MKWIFLDSGFNNGKYNMDYDLQLAKNCKEDEVILRLYRWNPYCISLGANQSLDAINSELADVDNIDITKRPTGGRAVLHSEELTYSVIYPLVYSSSVREIYNQINIALLKGLRIYDSRLSSFEVENQQPNFSEIYKQEKNAVCFAVSAKSEIKFSGKKIVGSAQRKFERVVLQHGSILCGPFHKRITKYLNLSEESIKEINNEIEEKTTELSTVLDDEIDYFRLASSIYKGFEEQYNMTFSKLPFIQNNLILSNN